MNPYDSKDKQAESMLLAALTEYWDSTPRPTPMGLIQRFRGCVLAFPASTSIGPSRLIGRHTTASEKRKMLEAPSRTT